MILGQYQHGPILMQREKTMSKQGVGYFFDSLSDDYTAVIERCFPRYREMLWALLDYLPSSFHPKNIVELGCGTGNLSSLLVDRFPDSKIHFVDLSAESIQECKQRLGNQERFTFERGMRIAQMVVASVVKANLISVDNLDATVRGSGGFGHTGI